MPSTNPIFPPFISRLLSRLGGSATGLKPGQTCHNGLSRTRSSRSYRSSPVSSGTLTPISEVQKSSYTERKQSKELVSPFFFDTGYALFAKRPPKPFPSSFLASSVSFSDPFGQLPDNRCFVDDGQSVRGVTNGDDAVLADDRFIGVADGVGAWTAKEKGHAGLWSRLILHYWSIEAQKHFLPDRQTPDPIAYLDRAFEQTKAATSSPAEWFGTTTACSAIIGTDTSNRSNPLLHITQLGDSRIMVIRPATGGVVFQTLEQWHWFDCPRQLGTNSPDTPLGNAVLDKVPARQDDVVLAMSDGVTDNLWDHEIVTSVTDSIRKWHDLAAGTTVTATRFRTCMQFVAEELVLAAKKIATDPFAESPYMERAIDEGLSTEGGKPDDISVVAAQCKKRSSS